jgi:hypothetical protein
MIRAIGWWLHLIRAGLAGEALLTIEIGSAAGEGPPGSSCDDNLKARDHTRGCASEGSAGPAKAGSDAIRIGRR